MDSDVDTRNSSPEEKNPKRRMKTPFQLEALERVYAEDRYPTEAVRAELSLHLNLSDKQLQMWFCHRRLKERKGKEDEVLAGSKRQKTYRSSHSVDGCQTAVLEPEVLHTRTQDPDDDYDDCEADCRWIFRPASSHREKSDGHKATFVPRKGGEALGGKWSIPRTVAGSIVIAALKSHLGEDLRDDGPELGVQFDSLPPGAFGASIERKSERKVPTATRLLNENKAEERQEIHPIESGEFGLPRFPTAGMKRNEGGGQNVRIQHLARASQPVQFLPEEPNPNEDNNHRQIQLNLDPHSDRSYELVPACRVRSLSPLGAFLPANMHLTLGDGYGFQQQRVDSFGVSLLPPGESRASGLYANGLGLDEAHCRGLYRSFELEGQGPIPQCPMQEFGANQLSVGFESLALFQEQEQARVEKKRKTDEMKIAKESEACAKRMRRDLERQEVLRRKREEQMRKELEKQERDKRKEEERAVREKQREVERMQRELRREIERREKIALKENKKMEKQHRREEVRKAKEAARLKAATERAAAKRTSKEWMDTIEDEQLEILEASTPHELYPNNGSESGDTEVNESSKAPLKKFPPVSVEMKPGLSFCPWNGPDHIAGNFFMVWRFLTTFADVIGLWPFTLDEFGQALHDFDPRLLGEIHVCLIKMVVKSIEDAAQAASGAGGSQNAINVVSGGHPQIVEAAYDWGFDIREWGQFLNVLTWPDILRQFGLAAGYGPKWRRCIKGTRRSAEDSEEHIEGESAVTVLRSGVAAANAVALMQGKGVGHLRRCRYRLTPGTVKYAAFHVLSLEGSKGLTILEVAEKIQKSGLRDLTTSKTPEASIAAALSRDTNLFDRVAPSTYCVRPAFRKDAEEATEVMQSARERIDLFQSGFLDVEEADKETDETEEMERDDDYDSDGQDAEDGDLHTRVFKDSNAQDEIQAEVMCVNNLTDEEVEVDESQVGEPWVQGLMEGEYSDLSIEERLMALVALVNVVNEGNTIRLALEARMEASGTLKRQMWAETQIDRRRHKEEQLSRLHPVSIVTYKNECGSLSAGVDAGAATIDEKPNEPKTRAKNGIPLESNALLCESATAPDGTVMSESNLTSHEKNLIMHEKDTLLHEGLVSRETALAPCLSAERSRAQVKLDIGVWAEELYMVRSLPLGLDRRRNRYWQFVTCNGGQDPSQGRIYFESAVDGHWEIVDTEEALDALLMSLDVRGTREAALHAVLGTLDGSLRGAMRAAEVSRSCSQSHVKSDTPEAGNVSEIFEGAGPSRLLSHTGGDGNSYAGHGLQQRDAIDASIVDLETNDFEKQSSFGRLKELERWIWSENSSTLSSFRASKILRKRESDLLIVCAKCHDLYWAAHRHCQTCHRTVGRSQVKQDVHAKECDGRIMNKESAWQRCGSSSSVPPRIQILKCHIISMEVVVPSETCKDLWDQKHRTAWASLVKCAITPSDLLQVMAELESTMEQDRLPFSQDTSESLSACKSSLLAVDGGVAPWVPHTSAAVGLRMMAFDAALAIGSEQKKRQKHVEEEQLQHNVLRTSSSVSALHAMNDSATTDNLGIEDYGEVLGDLVTARGRGRGKASRGKRTNKKSDRPADVKKISKHELQEEISAIATKDVLQVKIGGRGHGRSRGRPRGDGMGRKRGRGSRVASRNQFFLRSTKKPNQEKDPNELISRKLASKRSSKEHSPVIGETRQESDDEQTGRNSVWELDDPQEREDDENVYMTVDEEGDGNGRRGNGHQADKGDQIQDKESVNCSHPKGRQNDAHVDENVQFGPGDEDQDLYDGAESVK